MNSSGTLYAMYLAAPELFDRGAQIAREINGESRYTSPSAIARSEASSPSVIARSEATKQSRAPLDTLQRRSGLLRYARNDASERARNDGLTVTAARAPNAALRQAIHALVRSLIAGLRR